MDSAPGPNFQTPMGSNSIYPKPDQNDSLSTQDESNKSNKLQNSKDSIKSKDLKKVEILKNIENPKIDMNFKIIVIGNTGVGKSCLSLRATQGVFEEKPVSTLGIELFGFIVRIENKIIKLQIWDTCGQEQFKSLISNYYRNSSLAIIVYSVTDENSFIEIKDWYKQLKERSSPNCKVFLIGNKVDLVEQRVITTEMGEKCKNNEGFNFFMETSAKSGLNTEELFVHCAIVLYKQYKNLEKSKSPLNEYRAKKKLQEKFDLELRGKRKRNHNIDDDEDEDYGDDAYERDESCC